jgi:hypothetical protein
LCGQILNRLERKGEQGAESLFSGMMGNRGMIGGNFGGAWVIGRVENELTYGGYLRRTTEQARFTGKTTHLSVDDCERIQTLTEDSANAVNSWHQAWAADPQLYDALFADAIEAMEPPKGGGG